MLFRSLKRQSKEIWRNKELAKYWAKQFSFFISPEDIMSFSIANQVLDSQIHLELCISSNSQTGVTDTFAHHPAKRLYDLGFNIGLNTDNRLMSRTSLSKEFTQAAAAFGWGAAEFRELTLCAMNAAFTEDKGSYLKKIGDAYDQL